MPSSSGLNWNAVNVNFNDVNSAIGVANEGFSKAGNIFGGMYKDWRDEVRERRRLEQQQAQFDARLAEDVRQFDERLGFDRDKFDEDVRQFGITSKETNRHNVATEEAEQNRLEETNRHHVEDEDLRRTANTIARDRQILDERKQKLFEETQQNTRNFYNNLSKKNEDYKKQLAEYNEKEKKAREERGLDNNSLTTVRKNQQDLLKQIDELDKRISTAKVGKENLSVAAQRYIENENRLKNEYGDILNSITVEEPHYDQFGAIVGRDVYDYAREKLEQNVKDAQAALGNGFSYNPTGWAQLREAQTNLKSFNDLVSAQKHLKLVLTPNAFDADGNLVIKPKYNMTPEEYAALGKARGSLFNKLTQSRQDIADRAESLSNWYKDNTRPEDPSLIYQNNPMLMAMAMTAAGGDPTTLWDFAKNQANNASRQKVATARAEVLQNIADSRAASINRKQDMKLYDPLERNKALVAMGIHENQASYFSSLIDPLKKYADSKGVKLNNMQAIDFIVNAIATPTGKSTIPFTNEKRSSPGWTGRTKTIEQIRDALMSGDLSALDSDVISSIENRLRVLKNSNNSNSNSGSDDEGKLSREELFQLLSLMSGNAGLFGNSSED